MKGDVERLGISTKLGEHVDEGIQLNGESVLSRESILCNSNKSAGMRPEPIGILFGYVASDGDSRASATALKEARGSFPSHRTGL